MKKYKFILAAVGVAAIGVGIFSACQKDEKSETKTGTNSEVKSSKIRKSVTYTATEPIGVIVVPIGEIPCMRMSVDKLWNDGRQRYTAFSHTTEVFKCNTDEILTSIEFVAEILPHILDQQNVAIDYMNIDNFILRVDGQPVAPDFLYDKPFTIIGENGIPVTVVVHITYESVVNVWNEINPQMDWDEGSNSLLVDEQIIIEAHNIMVDFLLRSKHALDNNTIEFEAVCAAGNMEGLIGLIYSDHEAMQMGIQFTGLINEISAAYQTGGSQSGTNYCSECALQSFPETLRNLNYALPPSGDDGTSNGWDDLAICFFECGVGCACCPVVYPECVAICTAMCYMLSSNAYVAPYSYDAQAYTAQVFRVY